MTDAPTPPTSVPDPPAPSPRRWDWRPKARWFAAEYLIVVLGVLTAVGINAWWGDREDRAREHRHLLQLAGDLAETERVMARADSVSLPWDRVGNRLWAAFYSETPPPRDSLMWWRIWADSYVTDARPLLGTAEALIATGNLALIRDDSLRAAIVAYVEETRSEMGSQARLGAQWHEAQAAMDRGIDNGEIAQMLMATSPEFLEGVRSVDPTFTFPAASRIRFPLRPERLFEDRALALAAWTMRNAKANLRSSRGSIRDAAATLRERVEAHIEP